MPNIVEKIKIVGNELFTDHTDTPADYAGAAGQFVRVNQQETGLIFDDAQGAGLTKKPETDTWVTPAGDDGYIHDIGQLLFLNARIESTTTPRTTPKAYYVGTVDTTDDNFLAAEEAIASALSEASNYGINLTEINTVDETFKLCVYGLVEDVDTSAYSLGDQLYVSDTTPGELTNVQPATNVFPIGTVVKVGTTDGKIFVDTIRRGTSQTGVAPGLQSFIYLTGDTSDVATFYLASRNDEGTVNEVTITVDVDDDDTQPFPNDFLTPTRTDNLVFPAGFYNGEITVETDSQQVQEQFFVEIYLADAAGNAIDPQTGSTTNGSLGVPYLALLESELLDLPTNTPEVVVVEGDALNQGLIQANQRLRIRVLASKIGTSGGPKTFTLYFGTDHVGFVSALSVPELNELADVAIISPLNGNALKYDGTTQTWRNAFVLASEVTYDNASSGLSATNVQAAIDELDTAISGVTVSYGTEDQIPVTNAAGDGFDYTDDFKFDTNALIVFGSRSIRMNEVRLQAGTQDRFYIEEADNSLGIGKLAAPVNQADDTVAIGRQALENLTSSPDNIALGYEALNKITSNATGGNVAIGQQALQDHTGAQSTAVGAFAGKFVSGNFNVLIGHAAGKGVSGATTYSNAVVIGNQAGELLQAGDDTIAIGHQAGRNLGNSASNTIIGSNAMLYNKGAFNTVLGFQAMQGVSNAANDGGNNVFIGHNAGEFSVTGDNNIGIGFNALGGPNTGMSASENVALGHQAGQNAVTAANNVLVGHDTGRTIQDGSDNVLIGHSVDLDDPDDNFVVKIGNADRILVEGSTESGSEWVGSQFEARYDTINEYTAGSGVSVSVKLLLTGITGTGTGTSMLYYDRTTGEVTYADQPTATSLWTDDNPGISTTQNVGIGNDSVTDSQLRVAGVLEIQQQLVLKRLEPPAGNPGATVPATPLMPYKAAGILVNSNQSLTFVDFQNPNGVTLSALLATGSGGLWTDDSPGISTTENVGIGKTSEQGAAAARLSVSGEISITNGGLRFDANTLISEDASDNLTFADVNVTATLSELLLPFEKTADGYTSNSNIGVNVDASATYAVSVSGDMLLDGNLLFREAETGPPAVEEISIKVDGSGNLIFQDENNTTALTLSQLAATGSGGLWTDDSPGISTTQNVGIGSASDSTYQLKVDGDQLLTGKFIFKPSGPEISIAKDASDNIVFTDQSQTGGITLEDIVLWEKDTNGITTTSNVGIGVASSTVVELIVDGTAQATQVNISDTATFISKDANDNMVFTDGVSGAKTLAELAAGTSQWTSDTNGIKYDSGNVGINIASSASIALLVNGEVRANSLTIADDNIKIEKSNFDSLVFSDVSVQDVNLLSMAQWDAATRGVKLRVAADNVGLGVDPTVTEKLTVSGITRSTSYQVEDSATSISKDTNNNLVFTDAVSGSQTLADLLSSGGTTVWTTDTNGITYTGGNVGIGTASDTTVELTVDGRVRADTYQVGGASTRLTVSTSGDLNFTDANTGTKTLEQLANFIGAADTPSSYAGNVGRILRVNSTADALEFVAAPSSPWETDTNGIKYDAGNVGINIASSASIALLVDGEVRANSFTIESDVTIERDGFGQLVFSDKLNQDIRLGSMIKWTTDLNGVKLRDSSDNVGIGKDPSTTEKLSVDGITISTSYKVGDSATTISKDSNDNLVLTDAVSGSQKLSDLIGGGGGSSPWSTDTNGITYTAGNVGIGAASDADYNLLVESRSKFNGNIGIGRDAVDSVTLLIAPAEATVTNTLSVAAPTYADFQVDQTNFGSTDGGRALATGTPVGQNGGVGKATAFAMQTKNAGGTSGFVNLVAENYQADNAARFHVHLTESGSNFKTALSIDHELTHIRTRSLFDKNIGIGGDPVAGFSVLVNPVDSSVTNTMAVTAANWADFQIDQTNFGSTDGGRAFFTRAPLGLNGGPGKATAIGIQLKDAGGTSGYVNLVGENYQANNAARFHVHLTESGSNFKTPLSIDHELTTIRTNTNITGSLGVGRDPAASQALLVRALDPSNSATASIQAPRYLDFAEDTSNPAADGGRTVLFGTPFQVNGGPGKAISIGIQGKTAAGLSGYTYLISETYQTDNAARFHVHVTIQGDQFKTALSIDHTLTNIRTEQLRAPNLTSAGAQADLTYNTSSGAINYVSSDKRLKKNIVPVTDDSLSLIDNLTVNRYQRRKQKGKNIDDKIVEMGVIAQDVQALDEDLVTIGNEKELVVKNQDLRWHLFRAVQQLSQKVKELEAQLADN